MIDSCRDQTIVIGSVISVKDGDRVKRGETIASWDPYNVPILTEKAGKVVPLAGLE